MYKAQAEAEKIKVQKHFFLHDTVNYQEIPEKNFKFISLEVCVISTEH